LENSLKRLFRENFKVFFLSVANLKIKINERFCALLEGLIGTKLEERWGGAARRGNGREGG
jgi:hypothetical protein